MKFISMGEQQTPNEFGGQSKSIGNHRVERAVAPILDRARDVKKTLGARQLGIAGGSM